MYLVKYLFFLSNVWSFKVLHMPLVSLIIALYKEIRVYICTCKGQPLYVHNKYNYPTPFFLNNVFGDLKFFAHALASPNSCHLQRDKSLHILRDPYIFI